MANQAYTFWHPTTQADTSMPKQNTEALTGFGKRLAELRKAAGYTQTELAQELGITQRMISYYEGHAEYPPSALLPKLAALLGVSTDALLGLQPQKKTKAPDTRLQRRFQQIEKMDTGERRQILQVIDAFIERAQLKQASKGELS